MGKFLQQEVTNQESETETEVSNFPNRPWEQHKTSPVSSIEPHVFDHRCVKKLKNEDGDDVANRDDLSWIWPILWYITTATESSSLLGIFHPWQPLWRKEQLISSLEAELTTRLKAQLVDLFLDWISRMPFLTSYKVCVWGGGVT